MGGLKAWHVLLAAGIVGVLAVVTLVVILVVASSKRNAYQPTYVQPALRACPMCAETIMAAASICKHCKSPVEPLPVMAAPAMAATGGYAYPAAAGVQNNHYAPHKARQISRWVTIGAVSVFAMLPILSFFVSMVGLYEIGYFIETIYRKIGIFELAILVALSIRLFLGQKTYNEGSALNKISILIGVTALTFGIVSRISLAINRYLGWVGLILLLASSVAAVVLAIIAAAKLRKLAKY